jgi:hypothetical protein
MIVSQNRKDLGNEMEVVAEKNIRQGISASQVHCPFSEEYQNCSQFRIPLRISSPLSTPSRR